MKLTKYPQSCLLIEESDGGRVLIDLGNFATEEYDLDDFGEIDAVLFSHRHPDHLDQSAVDGIRERGIAIYANADVCGLIGEAATEVSDGEKLDVAGFEVTAHDIPHATMVDGSPGPPNTGFLFDGRLLHPGDGADLGGFRADVLALPIAGPSISFRDAYRMVEQTGAQRAVPMHYHFFMADPHQFAGFCDIAEVVVLESGESVEV